MNHVRNIARTALALALLTGTAALAQTSGATSTVAASNSLIAAGSADLSPSSAGDLATASDSSTLLSFATNDGLTYKITVTASVWGFTPPTGVAATATDWPLLTFVNATNNPTGTTSGTATMLVSAANEPAAAVDVLTGITSVDSSANVTISADYVQTVVAGDYSTTLTYTLVATP